MERKTAFQCAVETHFFSPFAVGRIKNTPFHMYYVSQSLRRCSCIIYHILPLTRYWSISPNPVAAFGAIMRGCRAPRRGAIAPVRNCTSAQLRCRAIAAGRDRASAQLHCRAIAAGRDCNGAPLRWCKIAPVPNRAGAKSHPRRGSAALAPFPVPLRRDGAGLRTARGYGRGRRSKRESRSSICGLLRILRIEDIGPRLRTAKGCGRGRRRKTCGSGPRKTRPRTILQLLNSTASRVPYRSSRGGRRKPCGSGP